MAQWTWCVPPIGSFPFIWGRFPLKHDYGRKGIAWNMLLQKAANRCLDIFQYASSTSVDWNCWRICLKAIFSAGLFEMFARKMGSDQNPGWLGYIGDGILPSYIGVIISQYKDPYKPISLMEGNKGFEHCSNGNLYTSTIRKSLGKSCKVIFR